MMRVLNNSKKQISVTLSLVFAMMAGSAHASTFSASGSFTADSGAQYAGMAIQQLMQVAKQGDTSAQFFLANRYQAGSGVVKDVTAAFRWFMASAKQGAAPAQLNVGQMYATGKGVQKNLNEARRWLEMAARQGDNRASYNLALISERSNNFSDAFKWYELAARPEMLSDPVKQRAQGKIIKLSSKLSPAMVEQAKQRAQVWLQSR